MGSTEQDEGSIGEEMVDHHDTSWVRRGQCG